MAFPCWGFEGSVPARARRGEGSLWPTRQPGRWIQRRRRALPRSAEANASRPSRGAHRRSNSLSEGMTASGRPWRVKRTACDRNSSPDPDAAGPCHRRRVITRSPYSPAAAPSAESEAITIGISVVDALGRRKPQVFAGQRGCAAQQGNPLSPSHSITSSARIRNSVGTLMPSALAVVRLMMSS